ncbi:MAG TPA: dTDP-4-dehydrorhamnose 3,5-epimerase [Gallionella sp.]|nr:MAG: dTDP-4-dehydrorhamnose 3,5-epimerase [Gallionellales bacterium GWA2_54_124]OGT19132.1 MAG: dTDP-4-dehydrorhamnose 3,5-epimerase [Gallionellales bacterium RIFOXYD12_FULL_53_10]HCI53987.1 dTDP-4-dehydrorhamnose 3,5-epimerase [Gallionella sp.]
MKFQSIPLEGAFLVSLEKRCDERGVFARTYCKNEFAAHGIAVDIMQSNISTNKCAGIVRGMHFQRAPHAEVKLVRCIHGAIFDVIVDIRKNSLTYGQWYGVELSEDNGLMIVVPEGFAHGYQALSDGATAFYMVSTVYAPEAEGGLRYDDPALGIKWPLPVTEVSDKDRQWALLSVDKLNTKQGS